VKGTTAAAAMKRIAASGSPFVSRGDNSGTHQLEKMLWKLAGAGHVWPGGLPDYLPRLLGPSTSLVDANVEMRRFFQRFTVPLTR